jgi:xanthine/CO dehydrogenase XdhC/CoxF family maturation factor
VSTAPRDVAVRALAELDAGRPVALATLLGHDGPAYRRPGAQLLLGTGGPIAGLVSGGCVEDEIAARFGKPRPGVPARRMTIDTAGDEIDGLGVGCGGRLDVLVESLADGPGWRAWLEAVARGAGARRRIASHGTVGWRMPGGAAGSAPPDGDPGAWPSDVHARLRPARSGWLETVPRPPRLTVVGHGPEVEPLIVRAVRMGWRVRAIGPSRSALDALRAVDPSGARLETICAGRDAFGWDALGPGGGGSVLDLEPDERLVAASRRLDLDAAALAWGLRAGVRILGVVAGHQRRGALAARPELAGLALERVEGPVGLDLGADGPEEVATAIAARLVADLRTAAAPVWAVVPSAGAGRRLGGGKPLLRKGGETLLARALRAAEAACDGTLVVLGHDADRVGAELDAGARAVRAERWALGLAASLQAGLAALPAGARALVALPDMPGVDGAHLAALRRAAAASGGAASRYPDGRLGAPALLPADLVAAVVAGAPARGDAGFAELLNARSDLAAVPLREPVDLATPERAAAHGWRAADR